MFQNIILHVPHSSADFSAAGKFLAERYAASWVEAARDLVDWYTDELFVPQYPSPGIHPVVFGTCRTLCDVERMSRDPLEAEGLGITCVSLLRTYGRFSPKVGCTREIRQMYLDHHYRLATALNRSLTPLLLDCHSFSSGPTPLVRDASLLEGVDICIGFNDDHTYPGDDVVGLVRRHFEGWGYRVAVNTPFSNSKTVDTPSDYRSLMIEVSKALYMDEDTLEKKPEEFSRLKLVIEGLYAKLLP